MVYGAYSMLTSGILSTDLLLCLQAVLESIRDSLNEQLVIPEWLVDIFLGYGDAGAAHYTQMSGLIRTVDFKVGGTCATTAQQSLLAVVASLDEEGGFMRSALMCIGMFH